MRKIAVSLSKGGVGKTTTAVNLGAGLAMMGHQVLLVDTDTQGQAGSMLGLAPGPGLTEFVSGDLSPQEAIVQARDRLWLLAGGDSLAGLKRVIAQQQYGGERTLARALGSLDSQYDYVILDSAPGWDSLSINVLFYATEVLAPVSLEVMTLQGLVQFVQRVEAIQEFHPDIQLKYVLPTFLDRRVKKSEEILGQLRAYYGQELCEPIRYNVRLSEAPGLGRTIYEYDPTCPGAQDYQQLTERVAQDA